MLKHDMILHFEAHRQINFPWMDHHGFLHIIPWVITLLSNSHHQYYYIGKYMFSRGFPKKKPSFATVEAGQPKVYLIIPDHYPEQEPPTTWRPLHDLLQDLHQFQRILPRWTQWTKVFQFSPWFGPMKINMELKKHLYNWRGKSSSKPPFLDHMFVFQGV